MTTINELAFKVVAGLNNNTLIIYILFKGDSHFSLRFLNSNPNLPIDSIVIPINLDSIKFF